MQVLSCINFSFYFNFFASSITSCLHEVRSLFKQYKSLAHFLPLLRNILNLLKSKYNWFTSCFHENQLCLECSNFLTYLYFRCFRIWTSGHWNQAPIKSGKLKIKGFYFTISIWKFMKPGRIIVFFVIGELRMLWINWNFRHLKSSQRSLWSKWENQVQNVSSFIFSNYSVGDFCILMFSVRLPIVSWRGRIPGCLQSFKVSLSKNSNIFAVKWLFFYKWHTIDVFFFQLYINIIEPRNSRNRQYLFSICKVWFECSWSIGLWYEV